MGRPRFPKTDGNQSRIFAACEALGMWVWDLSQLGGEVLDCVVFWSGEVAVCEVKRSGCEGDLTDGERVSLERLGDMGIRAGVVTSANDVLNLFRGVE